MLGEGWTIPLNRYSIKIMKDDITMLDTCGKRVEGIWFKRYEIHSGYNMGLCASQPDFPEKVTILTADEVTEEFRKS